MSFYFVDKNYLLLLMNLDIKWTVIFPMPFFVATASKTITNNQMSFRFTVLTETAAKSAKGNSCLWKFVQTAYECIRDRATF